MTNRDASQEEYASGKPNLAEFSRVILSDPAGQLDGTGGRVVRLCSCTEQRQNLSQPTEQPSSSTPTLESSTGQPSQPADRHTVFLITPTYTR